MVSTISPDTAFVSSLCQAALTKSSVMLTFQPASDGRDRAACGGQRQLRLSAKPHPSPRLRFGGTPHDRRYHCGKRAVWLNQFDLFDAVLQDAHSGVVVA
jgi:hypothetical protein